jgi:transposase
MTTMPPPVPTPVTAVTVGVDTHADIHVAVAKDAFGRRVASTSVATTPAGYAALLGWAQRLGEVDAWGVRGHRLVWGWADALPAPPRPGRGRGLNRPDRSARRRRGKSDPWTPRPPPGRSRPTRAASPRPPMGRSGMIRSLRVARASAIKARTQAINALKALLVTAPDQPREQLRGRSTVRLVKTAAALAPGPLTTPLAAATLGLQTLARRYQALSAELATLDAELDRRGQGGRAPAAGAGWGRGGLGRGAASAWASPKGRHPLLEA